MATTIQCRNVRERIYDYVHATLNETENQEIHSHLNHCNACANAATSLEEVQAIFTQTLPQGEVSREFKDKIDARFTQMATPPILLEGIENPEPDSVLDSILGRMSGVPWWGVSLAMHGLVILLAGLISMAIKLPKPDDAFVTVTELAPRTEVKEEKETVKNKPQEALTSQKEKPPTDVTSTKVCEVDIPKNMLPNVELGDHIETNNPNLPDTHAALGNEESKIFQLTSASTEPDGGGGEGGSLLDDSMIGAFGQATRGSGNGKGGGFGDGDGTGHGAGRGTMGGRTKGGRKILVPRGGGNAATEGAVERALVWLAKNQAPDGSWDSTKQGGQQIHNIAMTGYALLAFLGAGHSEKVGKYQDNVKRGVSYLISTLKNVAGKKDAARWADSYSNGIACMALVEAAGMARIKETMEAAQKAVNGVDDAQRQTEGTSDREAWDYGPRGGANDSSVMAWSILAFKSAKVSNLKVNQSTFDGCLTWINAGQDLGGLKAGDIASYDFEGGKMAYRGTLANPNKGNGSIAVTAAAGLCRVMIGGAKLDDPGVLGVCNIIKNKNIPKKYPFDLYYGYYASLLMFQKGGEHWKVWNEVLKGPLLEGQTKGGDQEGSWEPVGAGHCANRIMSTALGCLCMEVYYRYAKLHPEEK